MTNIQEVHDALNAVATASPSHGIHGNDGRLGVLRRFGVKTADELQPDQYDAVIAKAGEHLRSARQ
jgi:hypothetical protein